MSLTNPIYTSKNANTPTMDFYNPVYNDKNPTGVSTVPANLVDTNTSVTLSGAASEALDTIEDYQTVLVNPSLALGKMRSGANKALAGIQQMRADELDRQGEGGFYDPSYAGEVQQSADALRTEGKAISDGVDAKYKPKSWLGKVGASVTESMPAALSGVAAGIVGGPYAGVAVGMGLGGSQVYGQKYDERRQMGDSPEAAEDAALTHAGAEMASEALGAGAFIKLFKAAKAGVKLTPALARQTFTDGAEEVVAGLLQGSEDAWRGQGKDPAGLAGLQNYFTSGQFLEEAAESFVGGAMMGGAIGVGVMKPIQMSYKPRAIEAAQQMDSAIKEAEASGSSTIDIGGQSVSVEEIKAKLGDTVEAFGLKPEEYISQESEVKDEDQARLDAAVTGLKDILAGEPTTTQDAQPTQSEGQETVDAATESAQIAAETEAAPTGEGAPTGLSIDSLMNDPSPVTIHRSGRVDQRLVDIIKDVHSDIGTNAKIAIFDNKDFETSDFKAFLESNNHYVDNIGLGRVFIAEKDGKRFYTIVGKFTDKSAGAQASIGFHEALGHITDYEHYASAPVEIQRGIEASFEQWIQESGRASEFLSPDLFQQMQDQGIDTDVAMHSVLAGRKGDNPTQARARLFREFKAHQIVAALQRSGEGQSVIEKYWKSLAAKLKSLYNKFRAQNLDMVTNVESFDQFVSYLYSNKQTSEVDVENLNTNLGTLKSLQDVIFDSIFEMVDGKRKIKNKWKFKKLYQDGKTGKIPVSDMQRTGFSYKELDGKTVVLKGKEVLFTIPWDASRGLSQASARMVATNIRDMFVLAALKPPYSSVKANKAAMIKTPEGKRIKMKDPRTARLVELMWERAAFMAAEEDITERQAFLKILSGEGSAFSGLRPGVAGTNATGTLAKNMDRWIAMHSSELSSALQQMPVSESSVPSTSEQEAVEEFQKEQTVVKANGPVEEINQIVMSLVDQWLPKTDGSIEAVADKVIFYFDYKGKDYTEIDSVLRNVVNRGIKDRIEESTGVKAQREVKNKLVAQDTVRAMHAAGMDTTIEELNLRSFDLNITGKELAEWAGTDNCIDARSTISEIGITPEVKARLQAEAAMQSQESLMKSIVEGRFFDSVMEDMSVRHSKIFDYALRTLTDLQNAYTRIRRVGQYEDGIDDMKTVAILLEAAPTKKTDIYKHHPTNDQLAPVSQGSIAMVIRDFVRRMENWATEKRLDLHNDIYNKLEGEATTIGPRYRYSKEVEGWVDQKDGKSIGFDPFNPGNLAEPFETGKPVAITNLYHGTTDDITEFRSKYLGALTGANSAKLGFFMAADPVTAGSYPVVMGVPREINKAGMFMNLHLKKVFSDVSRGLIDQLVQSYNTFHPNRVPAASFQERNRKHQKASANEMKGLVRGHLYDLGYITGELLDAEGHNIEDVRIDFSVQYSEDAGISLFIDGHYWLDQFLADPEVDSVIQNHKSLKKASARAHKLKEYVVSGEGWIEADLRASDSDRPIIGMIPAGSNIIKTVGKMQNPFVKDWKGGSYSDGGWASGIAAAKSEGHDGVIYLNAKDGVGYGHQHATNIFIFFEGNQVKSDFASVGAFKTNDGKLVTKEKFPESSDLFGSFDRVMSALGEDAILGSYFDKTDGFKKAYFSDTDAKWLPTPSGVLIKPGSGKVSNRWLATSKGGKLTLGKILDHPNLFKVYPELKDLKVEFYKEDPKEDLGWSNYGQKTIALNYSATSEQVRQTLFHELQHQVQGIEDFAGGSSPDQMAKLKQMVTYGFLEAHDLVRKAEILKAGIKHWGLDKAIQEAQRKYQGRDWDLIESVLYRMQGDKDIDAVIAELQYELEEAQKDFNKARSETSQTLYWNTAGEEESRRAGAMSSMTPHQIRVALTNRGIRAFSDLPVNTQKVRTDARSGVVYLSAVNTVDESSNDDLTFASYAMIYGDDLKMVAKKRSVKLKETLTGPYKDILKTTTAKKLKKTRKIDPEKVALAAEKRKQKTFDFINKMNQIKEAGERQGLSIAEVMQKVGFDSAEIRKSLARYNRNVSKFSQNETIIRLAEEAGLINEESGREPLESLIKVMFPSQTVNEPQEDGSTKAVVYEGSDGSLQSLSTVARDILINKLQLILTSKSGQRFDIESEKTLAELAEQYRTEWHSQKGLKKLVALLKYVQSSASDFLDTTVSGKELSFRLRRLLLQRTIMQRDYLVRLNNFAQTYQSEAERYHLYQILTGEVVAKTEDEKKFKDLIKAVNRSYGMEMQVLQVKVYKKSGKFEFFRYDKDMSDEYFPHMWKPEWFRNPTQSMIQSLLDANEATDRSHAKKLIQNFGKDRIRAAKFSNIEMARETDLGGWITDPIEVYQKYILQASNRLALLKEFGNTPEVTLAQFAIRTFKESRDPEALTKSRDLINRVLGVKVEDSLAKEAKAGLSYGVMFSVGLLLQHALLVQPGVIGNMAAMAGYKNFVKGFAQVLPALWGNASGKMNKRWAELAGVLAFTVNRELNDIVMEDEVRLKTDKALKSFGITQMDSSMRIVGAIVGKLYATSEAMRYIERQDGAGYARLKKLGIKPEKVLQPGYLQSQEWYKNDLRMAALAFVEDTNFVLDPMRTPSIIQGHPLGKLFFLFKNFAFQQHRFMLHLLKADRGKAFKSVVNSLAGGSLIMLARMLLQGDDPEKVLEKDGIVKTIWRAFMAGGGAGIFAEAAGSALIPGSGPQTGMAVDSPVFGLLETIGKGTKGLYDFTQGDATEQDLHQMYRAGTMAIQAGALAGMPAKIGVPINAALGITRPFAERALAPSIRQSETSYLQ